MISFCFSRLQYIFLIRFILTKVNQLQEVLQAFCLHNPEVGYCQGMNFIVGISLLFLEPEYAFW